MDWFVDFETRSRADLRKCGADVYARHESTEVLCMAYARGDEPVQLWAAGDSLPAALLDAVKRGEILHAHNAPFEIAIWQHVMAARHHWPNPHLSQWRCTAAQAAACALPRSLDGAAAALGLDVRKDAEGHAVMMQLTKPRKHSKHDKRDWFDEPDKFARLYDYCRQDVEVEREICQRLPPLSPDELEVWRTDQRVNERGVPVDIALAERAIEGHLQHAKRLRRELVELTGGEVTTARQVVAMLDWLAKQGANLPDLQKRSIEAVDPASLSPRACRVLQIRGELAPAAIDKYKAFRGRAHEGRIRGSHVYCGAGRTGRWAGSGVQLQNIVKGFLKPEEIDAAADLVLSCDQPAIEWVYDDYVGLLSSMVRSTVAAPAGKYLLVCDYNAIEARVLAWLSGQEDLLAAFRDGQDSYINLAARIYGKPAEEVTGAERAVGKVAVLGLGYQMGPAKFLATCEKFGVPMTAKLAGNVVEVYRGANPRIKSFWHNLERAAVNAVETRWIATYGKIRLQADDDWLNVTLPSGRVIRYRDPTVKEDPRFGGKKLTYWGVNGYTKKWEQQSTYGGKLVENVTQAVARDLLAAALVRLERQGFATVMHVHDEIVCESDVPDVKPLEAVMCELPSWAEGCPIAASGFVTKRYRK